MPLLKESPSPYQLFPLLFAPWEAPAPLADVVLDVAPEDQAPEEPAPELPSEVVLEASEPEPAAEASDVKATTDRKSVV